MTSSPPESPTSQPIKAAITFQPEFGGDPRSLFQLAQHAGKLAVQRWEEEETEDRRTWVVDVHYTTGSSTRVPWGTIHLSIPAPGALG